MKGPSPHLRPEVALASRTNFERLAFLGACFASSEFRRLLTLDLGTGFRLSVMDALTIGRVATGAAVNVETVRYYERRGLLPKPARTLSDYRVYSPDTVARVRFVKHAQQLGFSLKEIKELLSLRAAPRARCADVKRRAETKVLEIEAKVRALRGMRRALVRLVSECDGKLPASACPILESLDESKGST